MIASLDCSMSVGQLQRINPTAAPLLLKEGLPSVGAWTQQKFTSGRAVRLAQTLPGPAKHSDVDFARQGNSREFISAI